MGVTNQLKATTDEQHQIQKKLNVIQLLLTFSYEHVCHNNKKKKKENTSKLTKRKKAANFKLQGLKIERITVLTFKIFLNVNENP